MGFPVRVRASALIIQDDELLLIEFSDENGIHYNLPGGGTESGEALVDTVRRETAEEAGAEIEVGPAAFLYEYAPFANKDKFGPIHSLTVIFECSLKKGQIPMMPEHPDENQTGVRWIPLAELEDIILYPNIRREIQAYIMNKKNIALIEEQDLENYH